MKRICSAAIVIAFGVMGLVACGPSTPQSSNTPPATPAPAPKKEPVLYTGKSCLSQMAAMAARWAPDALPYHLESHLNTESDGRDGKSTVWQAMFASATRRTYRVFTCSGSRLPDSPPLGVTSTPEAPYSPNVAQLMFQSFQVSTDSDAAYTMSQQKGGDKLLEKNPKLPILYLLDWDTRNKQLIWVVIYGDSPTSAKGRGVIDATSGKFLRAG
jgi:hypothetical protein